MFGRDQQEQNAAMLDMDIQREEMLAFFQDYWKHIAGIAIFLVLLTGGIQVYRAADARTAAQQTAELLPLTSAPATSENAKALEDFANQKASGNRRALALLFAAGKYQTLNKPDDARRVLDGIAKSGGQDSVRDYARILVANLSGDTAQADKISKNAPWQIAVKEFRALNEKDNGKRRDLFGEIAADQAAPQGMRDRAAEFSGQNAAR